MTDTHALDTRRLASYLGGRIAGFRGPLSARKFDSGQSNPTYLLESPSGCYVLRRQPYGTVLPSAHAVDREFRVMKALAGTGVPVPDVFALCEDPDVIGSKFFVMQYLDGRLFWDPQLPEIPRPRRRAYYTAMIEVLKALAAIDIDAVALGDYGRAGNYSARQIDRWTRQYRATQTDDLPEMDALITWLAANNPQESGSALTHGDFRVDNLIFHRHEPRVIGVIDWELSTLGPPLVDLAYFCLMLRLPNTSYVRGLGGLDRSALGLPDEREIIDEFAAGPGMETTNDWSFWIAFHAFRFAAILQGVKKRHLDGNASNADAPQVGAMIGSVLQIGLASTRE